MIGTVSEFWTAGRRSSPAPDVEARLLEPLYYDASSLILAHLGGLVLNGLVILIIGGVWSKVFMAGNLAILVARVWVVRRIWQLPRPVAASELIGWRLPYQMVGYAWCICNAALCGYCNFAGNGEPRTIAVFLMLGTTGGIASRNASTPRFAMAQITIWLMPALVDAARVDRGAWVFLLLLYILALRSIVKQHYGTVLALYDAERASRRAQISLLEREAEVLGIFENAAAGVTEFDTTSNRYIRVNRIFCDMFGYTAAQLFDGVLPSDLTHPADRARQSEQWEAIHATCQSFEAERRFLRRDGTEIWCRIGVSVSGKTADGRPARLISVLQDITELKLADAALRASQDLLRLSLDIGGVGTFRRDYEAGVFLCGPETRQMIGLAPGDAPIPTEVWLDTVSPEDRPRLLQDFFDVEAEHRTIAAFEYRFLHPERGLRHAETRSRMEYDSAGQAVRSVGVIIDVTDRRRVEERLEHLARHDPLTDLPNRSLLQIRLDDALIGAARGRPCAVLCVDLDHFKEVNDVLGHPIGDALLRSVTERLKGICRLTDTVARLGGDEFAIVLPHVKDRSEAVAFAETVIATLAPPHLVDGHRLVIGTSIGIALAPEDGIDADRLMRNADMALYSAKNGGRGRHQCFEIAMEDTLQARRALEVDLREALRDDTFEVFYQPLVGTRTRRIRGFEALLRWRHAARGLVMPDDFIPLAEATGLIVPIGAFVLQRACAQAVQWPGSENVAVNLSAFEFSSPDIVSTVASALHRSGLAPQRLELEITESTMLQDTQATTETLGRLKSLGVRISIDDFGTGFSSLSYLQRFPFDKVKIDRSFVAPLGRTRESLAIVAAVIKLCSGLDMETVAEGVETEEQLDILSGLGCTEAQGYYFSRPQPACNIPDLIARLESAARLQRPDDVGPEPRDDRDARWRTPELV